MIELAQQSAAESTRATETQAAQPPADAAAAEVESHVATGSGKQKITVVNKIPATLLAVLEQQFQLMHGWMEPIFTATNAQTAEIQELKRLLDDCLADYAKLIGRVGTSRKKQENQSYRELHVGRIS